MQRTAYILLAIIFIMVSQSHAVNAKFEYESAGAGFDVSFVIPDAVHPTAGWGGLLQFMFDMGDIGKLAIRPNIEMWLSGHEYNVFDRSVFETALNGDFKYYFPIPQSVPVRPYLGNGIAIIVDVISDDYNAPNDQLDNTDTDPGAGFEFLGGIDFPFTPRIIGTGEFKGKLGKFDLMKLTFGMTFLFGR